MSEKCPNCGSKDFTINEDKNIQCDYCNSSWGIVPNAEDIIEELKAKLFRARCGRTFDGVACDKKCKPEDCEAHPDHFDPFKAEEKEHETCPACGQEMADDLHCENCDIEVEEERHKSEN